ncbi:MAG TPA: hypothetical protein EYP14_04000 [Planctomycetaceae bacterium]|nr:hypothetical protein [Planctomycetaceae bacterium]
MMAVADVEGAPGSSLTSGTSNVEISDVEIVTPVGRLPAWMQEWVKSPTWKRDRLALRLMGETGVARRSDAQEMFAQLIGVGARTGSVHRAFRRLIQRGVVEVIEATAGLGARHLIRLTEKGQDAYRLLFGKEPVPSQTTELLKRHKSPDHVMLVLATGDVLRDAGWRVDLFPKPVDLDGGSRYEPDLVAVSPDGEVAYVECERMTRKNPTERKLKWQRCYIATGGDIYIAVPDQQAEEAIRSEVLRWLGGKRIRLRMMVVAEAEAEKPWVYDREHG